MSDFTGIGELVEHIKEASRNRGGRQLVQQAARYTRGINQRSLADL
jgi:hypothetical protein